MMLQKQNGGGMFPSPGNNDGTAGLMASPDHSTDATFSLQVWYGLIGGSALGTDPDPNVTPPAAGRIVRPGARRSCVQTMGNANGSIYLCTLGGATLSVQPWFYDDLVPGGPVWIKHGAVTAVAIAGAAPVILNVGNVSGSKWFFQITANTGVTAFAADFR